MTEFEKLDKYITDNNIAVSSICRQLGFSSGLYSQWRSGAQKPTEKKLIAVAKACGISLDYLFSESDTEPVPAFSAASDLDDIERAVLEKLHNLPLAEKIKAAALILG